MLHTRLCDLLDIEHPIVLGGMAGGTGAPLAAAVSNAGGLGVMGLARLSPEQVRESIAAVRTATRRPFGVNFLLFTADEAAVEAALAEAPPVVSFAWARREQDLRAWCDRAHAAGSQVMYMADTVAEARRAAQAGADVIVAQGSEGGGHVGWMGTLPLVPMVIDAVAPLPVLAAGGIADGRGVAAALALGADGALLGTRFLATAESPLPDSYKQAILDSDGHDTVLTEIPDIARGSVWPGAMARALRNGFIARWAGREWELRRHQSEAAAGLVAAREQGDVDNGMLLIGQDAGLVHDLPPAGDLVARLVTEAEAVLRERLPAVLR